MSAPLKRIRIYRLFAILILGLISSCQPALPTRAPDPTLQPLKVYLDPAVQWFTPALNACTGKVAGLGILMTDRSQANISLQYGPADNQQGSIYLLGEDELVIAVNAKNSITELSLQNLQSIFRGQSLRWSDFDLSHCAECDEKQDQIALWTYSPDSSLQQSINAAFRLDSMTPSAKVAADPGVLQVAIAADPNAIGILPKRWLNESIKAVSISSENTQLSTKLPVLAISQSEPQGVTKDWLVCLQGILSPGS